MIHLNDEILNRYTDNELDSDELARVNEHLKICHDCLSRLKAQRIVEQQLRAIDTYHLSSDFTKLLMHKIEKVSFHYKPRKSYFFRFIFSFFLLSALSVVGFLLINIPTAQPDSETSIWIRSVNGVISYISAYYRNIFTGRDTPIITTILTFAILISIYVMYESHRQLKSHLRKL